MPVNHEDGVVADCASDTRRRHKEGLNLPPLPVDHGWAWFVMLGAFLNLTFIMMFIRSTAILFIEFLEKYQESATMTTLAFGFCSATFALCNLFGPTVLLKRFQVRSLALVGSVINFISMFLIAFAPNMIMIDAMMACLGFSHGLISVPQMTLIGRYFKKRLTFATAFVSLGLSISTMAGPPFAQFLLDMYGLQGTMMILAGINLNCIPASMLLKPDNQYAQDDVAKEMLEMVVGDKETAHTECDINKVRKDIHGGIYEKTDIKSPEDVESLISGKMPPRLRSVSESVHKDDTTPLSYETFPTLAQSTASISKRDHRDSIVSEFIDMVSISSSIRYISDPHVFTESSFPRVKPRPSSEHVSESLSFHEKNLEPSKEQLKKHVSAESLEPERSETFLSKIRHSISGSIYTHPLAILLLIATGCGVHTQPSISYMPATGRENGLTDDQIPYLITIVGACDLVSKLAIGYFADFGYVKRIYIASVSGILVGSLIQFVGFFQGFSLMILLQIGVGLTVGVLHALVAVIIVDTLGVKHLGHIMAGYFLVNGFVLTIDHIVMGSLKDLTGSFLRGYNYFGALILISAFLLLAVPLVARLRPAPQD